jgi:DNA invertase Pin-like site-specific DNA recombinase
MTTTLAYSYVRFSHPDQAQGDSLRRQTKAAADWCQKNHVTLDSVTTLHDLGKSAFTGSHRKNPDRHALAAFLKLVEEGKVPRGSYLIIENLDRLSREHIQPALLLALNLLQSGIRLVQLKPAEMVFDDQSDTLPVMMMMMELSRGHGESAIKSERVGEAWHAKKEEARQKGTVLSTRPPAWLEVVGRVRVGKHARGGEFRVIPERARLVKKLFELACNGYGFSLLVKYLTAEQVPPWGWGQRWSKTYLHKIITGRAVLGEYQPRKGGKKDGAAIPGYYPAVVEESTWHRAQEALAQRKDCPGRVGRKVASLFSGLLWDAQTHSRLRIALQTRGSGKNRQQRRVLVSADSTEGRSPSVSFPNDVFETEVLRYLSEIRPADVLGEEPESESVALAGELAGVEQRMRQIEEALVGDGDDVPALARVLKSLDEKRQDLQRRLAVARQKESNPTSAAWMEAQTLLAVAKDEASRLRLRGLLRAIVAEAWVLVVPRRSHRLAVVQFHFAGGARRDYFVAYRSAGRGRRERRWARSLASVIRRSDLDLRSPGDVCALESILQRLSLAALD